MFKLKSGNSRQHRIQFSSFLVFCSFEKKNGTPLSWRTARTPWIKLKGCWLFRFDRVASALIYILGVIFWILLIYVYIFCVIWEVNEGWTLGSFSLATVSQVDWWNRQPDRHDLGTIIHELKLEGFHSRFSGGCGRWFPNRTQAKISHSTLSSNGCWSISQSRRSRRVGLSLLSRDCWIVWYLQSRAVLCVGMAFMALVGIPETRTHLSPTWPCWP